MTTDTPKGMVNAGPVREHAHQLIENTGCSSYAVSIAAGVAADSVARVVDGTHEHITVEVADRILAVRPHHVRVAWVPASTIRDHLARLNEQGWPDRAIAQAAGVSTATVYSARTGKRDTIGADIADWLSQVTADLLRGHCPDDDPSLPARAAEHLTHLLSLPGVTPATVMQAAGVSSDTVNVLRAGRTPRPAQSRAVLAVTDAQVSQPDPAAARAHLRLLVDVSGVVAAATATGLNKATVRKALAGGQLAPLTVRKILGVPVNEAAPSPFTNVDARVTRRRLHAIARAGWPMAEVARRLGRGSMLEPPGLRTRHVRSSTRDQVADLYEELAFTPGPSTHAAKVAQSKCWAAVQDWDHSDMTDPAAWPRMPNGPRRTDGQISKVVTAWLDGVPAPLIADRYGLSRTMVDRIAAVYGRWKLADEPWLARTGEQTGKVSVTASTLAEQAG